MHELVIRNFARYLWLDPLAAVRGNIRLCKPQPPLVLRTSQYWVLPTNFLRVLGFSFRKYLNFQNSLSYRMKSVFTPLIDHLVQVSLLPLCPLNYHRPFHMTVNVIFGVLLGDLDRWASKIDQYLKHNLHPQEGTSINGQLSSHHSLKESDTTLNRWLRTPVAMLNTDWVLEL
jgi:hypothetical protein